MAIGRRVTSRFYKRVRKVSPTGASPSVDLREESDVRNLPVAETRSGLVAMHASSARHTHAPTSGSSRLSAYLRDARARAEQILREHPCHKGDTASTCQLCSLAYPCDAVRAAEDVIAISAKLQVGRLRSSKALLEFMMELADLGATDTVRERSKASPPAARADGPGSPGLTPH
jgi:hypothetical protein